MHEQRVEKHALKDFANIGEVLQPSPMVKKRNTSMLP